ncbi:hypothetical protein GTO89_14420 [Heliobacterium gestii]|uniref:Uncharacterized protein n=1 Tax=Heliomicrobium gestii TaxID=2699 RepID=A0A845LMW0_HELGE|nr:hypothetical protein [Heliomicrobium gestii]MBM7867958.1 uncharacterized protein Yka (UPF0111/DUF47 family) [Heliomicrobium gestii]MZP44226.1 hypothetical protein [Heliomicrobium gestii]
MLQVIKQLKSMIAELKNSEDANKDNEKGKKIRKTISILESTIDEIDYHV